MGSLRLHQGQNVRVTMEFEVSKRRILRPTLSTGTHPTGFALGEIKKRRTSRKRQGSMAKKWCYNNNNKLNEFFLGKRRWRQEKTWERSNFFLLSKLPFLNIYQKKNQHIHFWVHGHSSWSTFGSHLVWGPKTLYIDIFEKLDHGCWSMEKDHLPWSDFMVHGVNWPLVI